MLYVYAIMEASDGPLGPSLGHDDAVLTLVVADGLAAVCSRHDDGLDLVAGHDEESLWRHEHVVEALATERAVLPVRFGTMVRDEQALADFLAGSSHALRTSLELVGTRQEVGVRVLWDPPSAPSAAPAQARGAAYLHGRLALDRAARDRAESVHAALCEHAVAARHRVLVTDRMLLSGAYLVERTDVGTFVAAADELAERHDDLQIVCTGPWPAHTFASLTGAPS
jgi:Gas vesicle synthesis protein GvpL/GvpF